MNRTGPFHFPEVKIEIFFFPPGTALYFPLQRLQHYSGDCKSSPAALPAPPARPLLPGAQGGASAAAGDARRGERAANPAERALGAPASRRARAGRGAAAPAGSAAWLRPPAPAPNRGDFPPSPRCQAAAPHSCSPSPLAPPPAPAPQRARAAAGTRPESGRAGCAPRAANLYLPGDRRGAARRPQPRTKAPGRPYRLPVVVVHEGAAAHGGDGVRAVHGAAGGAPGSSAPPLSTTSTHPPARPPAALRPAPPAHMERRSGALCKAGRNHLRPGAGAAPRSAPPRSPLRAAGTGLPPERAHRRLFLVVPLERLWQRRRCSARRQPRGRLALPAAAASFGQCPPSAGSPPPGRQPAPAQDARLQKAGECCNPAEWLQTRLSATAYRVCWLAGNVFPDSLYIV